MLRDKLINLVEKELWSNEQKQVKKANKLLRFVHGFNHKMFHMEEVLMVFVVALFSFMLAHYTGLSWIENKAKNQEIAMHLKNATDTIAPGVEKTRIISQRVVNSDVENTFYKWYCTYGAALISPEFFPYISDTQQERTRWWNAADWYLNAQIAGFKVGSEPREGALIIYKRGKRFVNAWHVGKVIKYFPEYGKMIVRDMNRVGRGIMSDRREYEDTSNIMWYIYPKQDTIIEKEERIDDNATKDIPEDVLDEATIAEDISNIPQVTGEITEEPKEEGIVTEFLADTHASADANIDLDFSALSIEAQHFLSQRDIQIKSQLSNIKVGESKKILIAVTNKKTWEKFSGILPIAFNLITSSSAITLDYSTIQLIYDGQATILATANATQKTAILINFGQKQIWKLKIQAK